MSVTVEAGSAPSDSDHGNCTSTLVLKQSGGGESKRNMGESRVNFSFNSFLLSVKKIQFKRVFMMRFRSGEK